MTDYFLGFSQRLIRYPHFLKQRFFFFFRYLNHLENYFFSKTQLWTLRNLWCSLCPFLLQLPKMGTTCICSCIFGWEKQYAQIHGQKISDTIDVCHCALYEAITWTEYTKSLSCFFYHLVDQLLWKFTLICLCVFRYHPELGETLNTSRDCILCEALTGDLRASFALIQDLWSYRHASSPHG